MTADRNAPTATGPIGVAPASALSPTLEAELAALAPLAEPVRRRLYLLVAGSPEPVGRDEAAAALGIARSLAAFHLDRLVDDGLLQPEYRRRSGRTGPGAGRPAKLYSRTAETHAVSLPARNYELAARLFADALTDPDPEGGPKRVWREAFGYGKALGERISGGTPASDAGTLMSALAAEGFEPRSVEGVIRLGNCPFHALAAIQRDLTCGMNLALMSGLLNGLGAEGWEATLDPRPGLCCVAFASTTAPVAGRTATSVSAESA